MRCDASNNGKSRGRYAIGVGSVCVLCSKFVLQAHGLTAYCSYGISHVFDQRLSCMFHRGMYVSQGRRCRLQRGGISLGEMLVRFFKLGAQ